MLALEEHKDAKFKSFTFREDTPDGTAWIHIVETEPGKIGGISMSIGKGQSSLNSYCKALAELCEAYIGLGGGVEDLIDILFNIISASTARFSGPNAPTNRSGAEAMASALRQYLQSI